MVVVARRRVMIRTIKEEDVEKASELLARLKRLNGEFDPLLKTVDNVEKESERVLAQAMSSKNSVVLVAMDREKIVGLVRGDVVDRTFYEPRKEGAIVEFYILPEFRRASLGMDLMTSMSERLRKKGANLITAEFPSQNENAKNFYSKLGFRSLMNVYAKSE